MKCLPAAKVPQANGLILHDWHAEVLAMRAFNRFLLDECHWLAAYPDESSTVLRRREAHEISKTKGLQPFTIHERLKLHMYCSEAPCGDASMELVMEAQEDATPWVLVESVQATEEGSVQSLRGREYFSELGIVRRKPCILLESFFWAEADCGVARADSPQTLSKSCSDKIALKQCTSLLSSLTSLFVSPSNAYLASLILPRSQCNQEACERALGPHGRLEPVSNKTWNAGYAFHAFDVRTTDEEFAFSRRSVSLPAAGSNLSAVYNPWLQESLINGVLQGRKQNDPRGGSALCNALMWKAASKVVAWTKTPDLLITMRIPTYRELKEADVLAERRQIKEETRAEALKGWVRNVNDDFDVRHEY